MSSIEESDSSKSQGAHEEHPKPGGISGEQNTVQGGATNGGFIFQGGGHQIEVTQYFGVQPSTRESESPLNLETIETKYFEPETILIKEGSFWMGSNPGEGISAYETPRHEIFLPTYRIGKFPVTNDQYFDFIEQTGTEVAPMMGWEGQRVPEGRGTYPVVGVTWFEALAYCNWLSEKTGRPYSLPTEAQWEKACRGGDNLIFPWGDYFDPKRSNYGNSALAVVDAYPPQNDLGCFDLVGNVRQWTRTLWGLNRSAPDPMYAYPWKQDRRNDLKDNNQIRRVVRGSSFKVRNETKDPPVLLRCSARNGQLPDHREDPGFSGARHGFRVVMFVS